MERKKTERWYKRHFLKILVGGIGIWVVAFIFGFGIGSIYQKLKGGGSKVTTHDGFELKRGRLGKFPNEMKYEVSVAPEPRVRSILLPEKFDLKEGFYMTVTWDRPISKSHTEMVALEAALRQVRGVRDVYVYEYGVVIRKLETAAELSKGQDERLLDWNTVWERVKPHIVRHVK